MDEFFGPVVPYEYNQFEEPTMVVESESELSARILVVQRDRS